MANGWKIARNRTGRQLPLILVAALAVALLLLGKAQGGLFDRARARLTDFAAPALETARTTLVPFNHWIASFGNIFVVYQENLRLKDENGRLKQWQNLAVVLGDKVKRYERLLHAVPDPKLNTLLAHVIGRSNRPFLRTMIIDAGRSYGVKPGQAVLDARGMIGRIFLTGDHTAWVILLTDLNSRVPVMIEPGNIQAMLAGDNTARPVLELVAPNARLKPGQQVVSSGDGGLLPPGLAVGSVVMDGRGNMRVALLADPEASQEVDIVDFKETVEQPPNAKPSDMPAIAAGLPPAAPPPPPVAAPTSPAAGAGTASPPIHAALPTTTKPADSATGAGAE